MNVVKFKLLIILLFAFLFLNFSDAYGGSILDGIRDKKWILTVYGGYDAAYQAWLKVGLLFGSGYKFIFAGIAVLGALIGFYALLIRLYTGARAGFISWGLPVLIGCVLYVTLVVPPQGGMHEVVIYDRFYNKYSPPISNIPPILAMAAGIMNYIEDNSIDLFDTSVSMLEKYEYNPGGFAFLFVANAFSDLADALVGTNFLENVNYFIGDCIIKWAYGTGRISAEDLLKDNFINILTKGASDSFYTKYRTSTDLIALTCKEASTSLSQDYNSLVSSLSSGVLPNKAEVRALCSAYGFDANNAVALRKCVDILNEGMRSLVFKGIGTSDIIGPLVVHKKFGDLLFSYAGTGGSALTPGMITATQTTTSSFIGAMIHANSWIPALKETMRAFSVVITPIVLLFIVTPIFARALGVLFGMQIWLLLWAVIDVIITGFSLSLASSIGQSGSMLCPGCGANVIELTAFPSMSMKIYAILGMMRWAGIGLATVISTMLIRFGGTALAMIAGQIAGAPMGSGSQAGVSGIKDPHGYVGNELVPRMAFTNAAFEVGGFRAYAMGRVAGATFAEASSVSAGYQTMTHTGGSFSGVASAGLSAGTVGATQNIASTVQGSHITNMGGPGLIGTGLGRLGAIDVIGKGLAGLKFSPEEVRSTAENLASVTETNIRTQARQGQVIKGREKEIADALGLEKGALQIAAYLALQGESKAFNELLKTGMDPIFALQKIGALGISAREVDDVVNKGKAEMDKAKKHGYSEDDIRSNIKNEKFAKELSDKGIDVESLRKYVDIINTVASLNLDINRGGFEKLKDVLRLFSFLEGMRLYEGEKEARFRQRGEGWQDVSKDPRYANMPWHAQHEFVARTNLSSVGGMALINKDGVLHLNIPDMGFLPIGIGDLNYQDSKVKKEGTSLEHIWAHKLSALDVKTREQIKNKMYEVAEQVKKYASSKDKKTKQDLEVSVTELVETSVKHGMSREQALDIIDHSIKLGVGGRVNLGGGGGGGSGGGLGLGAGVNMGGSAETGSTKHRKEIEKADISGSSKDQIGVQRFKFQHAGSYVNVLEQMFSGVFGEKFTFSDSTRQLLTNSFESAISGKETRDFSQQESLNKTFRVPDLLFSRVYNQALSMYLALGMHDDAPIRALRDAYIVSTNPELAAKYLEMALLNPEEAKKAIEDYLNNIKNHVENNISEISNEVPTQKDLNKGRQKVTGGVQQLKTEVKSGLDKQKKNMLNAEDEAKRYENKKEEEEKEILKENLKVRGSDYETKLPSHSQDHLDRIDKEKKLREQYIVKPPNVGTQLPEFPIQP